MGQVQATLPGGMSRGEDRGWVRRVFGRAGGGRGGTAYYPAGHVPICGCGAAATVAVAVEAVKAGGGGG